MFWEPSVDIYKQEDNEEGIMPVEEGLPGKEF